MRQINTSTTTYLYSKDNKNLYFQMLEDFNKGNCLFTRNLLAYLESSHKQPGPFYSKHLSECAVCQEKVKRYRGLLNEVKAQIPFVQADDQLESMIKPELKEILGLHQRKKKQEETKDRLLNQKFFKSAVSDFFKEALFSRTILKGVGWSFVAGVLVYYLV